MLKNYRHEHAASPRCGTLPVSTSGRGDSETVHPKCNRGTKVDRFALFKTSKTSKTFKTSRLKLPTAQASKDIMNLDLRRDRQRTADSPRRNACALLPPEGHLPDSKGGFALVATVTMMVLLAMIAVGMLSLSTITLRATLHDTSIAEAKANARLALSIALGELQKSLGPDQRINAPSAILGQQGDSEDASQSRLIGVWDARNDPLGEQPDYDRSASFRRWLASSANIQDTENLDFPNSGPVSDPVLLVGQGTMGSDAADEQHVNVGRIPLSTNGLRGGLAWWISDENSKALVNPDDLQEREGSSEVAAALARFGTPGPHGLQAIDGLENLESNTEVGDKVISHKSMELFIPDSKAPLFHDFTPHSQSLLTNVRTGGLRRDLNLFLERTDINWSSRWPRQRGPNRQAALSMPEDFDVLPWKHLHHHYHSERMVSYPGGRPTLKSINYNAPEDPITNPRWNSTVTRPAIFPVRVQVFIAYGTIRDNATRQFRLILYNYPVFTLWNPFNVDLQVDEYKILINAMPLKHRILINGTEVAEYNWRNGNDNDGGSGTTMVIKNQLFRAGESITFTPVDWNPGGFVGHFQHEMEAVPFDYGPQKAGSRWGIGDRGVFDPPLNVLGRGSQRISIETRATNFNEGDGAYRFLQTTFGYRGYEIAVGDGNWPMNLWSSRVGWRYEDGNPRPDSFSTNNASGDTFSSLLDAPRPLCVVDARLKALDEENLPNKTWVHTIPAHPYAAATSQQHGGDRATSYFSHPYAVTFQQVNSYQQAASFAQRSPSNPTQGFFGASFSPSGQTFITARELPLVPLNSLAQLQNLPQHPIDAMHWSGHHFQNNAIGNSFASPGIPPDQVKSDGWPFYLNGYINNVGFLNGARLPLDAFVPGIPNIDRSYAANHLLWDDYFFSSMADQSGSFYSQFGQPRGLRDVVEEFYEGTTPLPNSRYKPYLSGENSPEEIADSLVKPNGTPTSEAQDLAAANILVAGGFNINSTSVPAWTSLFASAHLRRPVVLDSEDTGAPSLEPEGQFIVSRYSMPNGPATNATTDEKLRWRGYRELTGDEIRELAEAMVRQVKQRGPFRSLGEFVNRRLDSSSEENSLYGALQAALEDPAVSINESYRDFVITPTDFADANYAFPRAAEGSRFQGSPAYVTQADLLNSIGPIIQARSDTFLIRAYGESRSDNGQKILAQAWCEAVVQRQPEYLDRADTPETPFGNLTSPINRLFGRRFDLVSFRWLNPDEV